MALTKISRGLLDTGVSDSSDATSITIDSSERVGINQSSPAARLHVFENSAEIARFEGNDEYAYIGLRGTVSSSATSLGYFGFANDTGTAADLNITNAQNGGISFKANSAERMRITSTGLVGIGSLSPSVALEVHDDASAGVCLELKNSNAQGYSGIHFRNNSDTLIGHVGYGNSSASNSALQDVVYFGSITSTDVIFTSADTERARIESTGEVCVGTGGFGGAKFCVNSDNAGGIVNGTNVGNGYRLYRHVASSGIHQFGSTGNIASLSNAGAWTNASDIAYKKDIVDTQYGLDTILSLQPRDFTLKVDESSDTGFIAQELETVLPQFVIGDEGHKNVNYAQITAVLTKAVQELKTELDAAKARIETLENA